MAGVSTYRDLGLLTPGRRSPRCHARAISALVSWNLQVLPRHRAISTSRQHVNDMRHPWRPSVASAKRSLNATSKVAAHLFGIDQSELLEICTPEGKLLAAAFAVAALLAHLTRRPLAVWNTRRSLDAWNQRSLRVGRRQTVVETISRLLWYRLHSGDKSVDPFVVGKRPVLLLGNKSHVLNRQIPA